MEWDEGDFPPDTSPAADHCITHTSCWTNDACPAPYTCVDIHTLNWEEGETMGGTAQVCARALPLDIER